jgi:putative transposase
VKSFRSTYFLDAAQQKLAEATCLFDLSEHRLHHSLSQSVSSFEAAVVDLFAHQLRQRSTNFYLVAGRYPASTMPVGS